MNGFPTPLLREAIHIPGIVIEVDPIGWTT